MFYLILTNNNKNDQLYTNLKLVILVHICSYTVALKVGSQLASQVILYVNRPVRLIHQQIRKRTRHHKPLIKLVHRSKTKIVYINKNEEEIIKVSLLI